jgi:hypothetical protein
VTASHHTPSNHREVKIGKDGVARIQCNKCLSWREPDLFPMNRNSHSGRDKWCKACHHDRRAKKAIKLKYPWGS